MELVRWHLQGVWCTLSLVAFCRLLQVPPLSLGSNTGRERLQFADQLAEPLGVVEPRSVTLGLVGAEITGHGLAVHLSGPRWVGAVETFGVAVAAAAGAAAARAASNQAARHAETELGDLGHDLSLATSFLLDGHVDVATAFDGPPLS